MTTKVHDSADPDIQKIGELIKGIKVAMMVTVNEKNELRGRPMMTQEMEFDGTLWFFSGDDSGKNDEIRADSDVQLTYVDTSKNRYVSLTGRAELVHDRAKATELWKPALNAWFPGGVNDPRLSLIRIDVTKGEYWDGPSKAMVTLRILSKAVQGKPYKGEGGQHKKVTL